MRAGVTPLEIAFWRAALAAVLFAVHALAIGRLRVAPRALPGLAAFGLAGVSVFYGAYLLAVQRGGAALASVLLYTAPAWVAIIARVVFGDRITARRAGAIALTLAGVALVAAGSGGGGAGVRASASGIAWGLVAGWAYALYYLAGRRLFERHAPATVFAVVLPIGALGLLPFVDFAPKTATAWAAIAFVAAVPTYGAYLLYAAGLRRVDPTRAATLATVEPVVAALAAWAAFGEVLPPLGYLGAAVVLAGVVLAARAEAAPARGVEA